MFISLLGAPLFSPYRMKARLSREHHKQVAATGRAPIYLRLTYGQGPGPSPSVNISTGVFLLEKEWDQRGQRVRGNGPEHQTAQATLTQWKAKADEVYLQLKNDPQLTVARLKDAVVGRQSAVLTLLAMADLFYQNKARPELHKAMATLRALRLAQQHLSEYLKHTRAYDLRADSVNLPWLRRVERWAFDRRGFSLSTTRKVIGLVQAVIDFGAHEGWLAINPVAKYKFEATAKEVDPAYLPEPEVQRLVGAVLPTGTLQAAADTWLFCCYTGLSFVDLRRFRADEHLHADEAGRRWIRMTRQKTGVSVSIPVFAEALSLLARYPLGLPVVSLPLFNLRLKQISKMLVLSLPLKSGLARHTASHRLRNVYGFTDEEAAAICGHSKEVMNEHYSRKREEGLSLALERLGISKPATPTLRQQLEAALAATDSPELREKLEALLKELPD